MNAARIRTVARRLTSLPACGARSESDRDLLGRFLEARDEDAFDVLVRRHFPAVSAVCRSVLPDSNDVDDAVQATFLVLVRRAHAVRDRQALGAWLCRVAWRTANRLREASARRADRQAAGIDPDQTPARTGPAADVGDVANVLHEEVGRLPERYRIAVLTCYAAGTPTAEAAARLGWPKGTLLTRLAWARKRLRDRLSKRGVTPAGGFATIFAARTGILSGALLTGRITSSAVALASSDRIAAKELVPDRVSSLTEGVVRAMIGTKIKLAVGIGFLAVALLGLGLGRMSAGSGDAGNKKRAGTASPANRIELKETTESKTESIPAAPAKELVVRRPLGTFTREIAPYGKATLTFTGDRLHILADVRIENLSFTVTADADYSMNRESMVYGIITGVDISGLSTNDELAELGLLIGGLTDVPFAFRVRADDDAISIKDLKFGPFGSLLFLQMLGGGENNEELALISSIVHGRYKADGKGERNAVSPQRR